MKLLGISLLLFLMGTNLVAQNLVDNWSFEDTVACPDNYNQVDYANGWSVYRPNSDFFHACSPTFMGVPNNAFGSQSAATGIAYCGFAAYNPTFDYNELLGRQLLDTMIIGTRYYVSIKVCLSEDAKCGVNNIGVLFSTREYCYSLDTVTNLCDSTPAPIINFAHVYSSEIIVDTANWTTISGSFVADSAYQYIIVGNLFNGTNTDTTLLYGYLSCAQPYYYVDDICASTDSSFCDMGTIIYDVEEQNNISVYPNPTDGRIFIKKNGNEEISLVVYDLLGELVFQTISVNSSSVDLSYLPNGIYFMNIRGDKQTITKKIIKITSHY